MPQEDLFTHLETENWSIEKIPLKTAEIGCVATLEEYRNRGLIDI
ncbi:MAG: hypothetical protein QHH24_02815 [Candidatus Bathyarchaeota archaeon]|nr:hypothetical protein [Candidatus Bathyarchaeota archaeon]